MSFERLGQLKRLLLIAVGVAIYTFGFVKFNMANALAEGGVAGVTLIVHALYGINPAYSSLILNIPLFILGARILGKRSLALTNLRNGSLVVFHLVLATGSYPCHP